MRVGVSTCVCIGTRGEAGRAQGGLHAAHIPEWHHGYHLGNRDSVGLINPAGNRALVSKVGVSPREHCASSEGGSGCCRVSILRTAPVKTNRRARRLGNPSSPQCVLMAPQGQTEAKEGRFKGNESFSKHRNTEGLIAGRIWEVMHHFLRPRILKADFSNEMHGFLPALGDAR